MNWSPFHPDILKNPAQGCAELLDRCPVHRCDEFDPPFYTLSRYADVTNALRDIQTFSSQHGQGPRFSDPVGMLCDPPQHTQLRQVVQQAFTPKAMEPFVDAIGELANRLIDKLLSGPGNFDLHDDFAFPLPVIIIAGMLGVPESDLERFKHWSDSQVAAMGAEDPTQYQVEQEQFFAYMTDHLNTRRRALVTQQDVPNDLLTLVADARREDGSLVAHADALSVLMQLLVGGNETTTSLITNMVWRLLQNPDQWQQVANDSTLVDSAIEESLRFDPPVLGLYRNTTRAVSLHGTTIPANAKVFINYAAANRDPSVFTNPDEFNIARTHKRHMSFGLGLHFCLGAPMARLEASIALRAFVQRLPNLRLIGDGERIAPFFLWGRRKLPVAWN